MTDVFDVVIVGAGPAGAAAAVAAKRSRPKAAVLLLDKSNFPRDKVCGDAVAPDAVEELRRLGLTGSLRGEKEVRRYRLCDARDREISGTSHKTGYIVPRERFDARLVAAAAGLGVELRRERATTIDQAEQGVWINRRWCGRTVIAADGANSVIRRLMGAAPHPSGAVAFALRGYAPGDGGSDFFVRWDDGGGVAYAWAFPTACGRLNAGYGLPLAQLTRGRRQLIERLQYLLPNVAVEPTTLRGHHLPLFSARPELAAGRILLAGDAAGLVNPLSGEGILGALASGRLAGEAAVAESRPDISYPRAVRRRFSRHWRQARLLSRFAGAPHFARAMVAAREEGDTLFDRLMDLWVGEGTLGMRDVAGVFRVMAARR